MTASVIINQVKRGVYPGRASLIESDQKTMLPLLPVAFRRGVSLCVASMGTEFACAQETIASPYAQNPGVMYFLKLSLTLAVVLGIFMLFAGIVRRMNGINSISRGPLKIVAGLTLGNRERLLIVKAGNTSLLIGVSNSGIEKLHQFDESLETEAIHNEQQLMPFKDRLQHLLNGLQK